MPAANIYQDLFPPKDLTFDEASLFWRLRSGEGIPHRSWHRPLDRSKNWHQIKKELDQKLGTERTCAIFKQVYPQRNRILVWLDKILLNIKRSFLLVD